MGETEDLISMLSPGEQLRMKREERGLEIEDIAQELLLSVKQVEAIENNDHENLPGPTYIIGYWKSYATLLELDLEEAIETYKSKLVDNSGGIVLDPHHQRAHGHQEQSRKKSAVVFFVLSGLFLAAIWYWQNPDDNPFTQWAGNQADKPLNALNSSLDSTGKPDGVEEPSQIVFLDEEESTIALPEPNFSENFDSQPAGEQVAQEEEVQISSAPPADQQTESEDTEPDSPPAVAESVETDITRTGTSESNTTETDVGESAQATTVSAEPAAEVPKQPDESQDAGSEVTDQDGAASLVGDGQAVEESTDNNEEQVAAASSEINSEAPVTTAMFTVTADSWLDVRDASGEKLVYRTVIAGENLEVTGLPPYSVFIGSATGVEVSYQGEIVEFEPHSSGLFARFELPLRKQE